MAYIAPFRALRYDPARTPISNVVTQPYDKITPAMQESYYAASPYNLVRIELGKRETNDNERESTYTRAASSFGDWRRQGVFMQEAQPSIYLYVQRFTPPGGATELERRGFIALGRIEDYSAGVVFRHEQTLAKPKADRLDLLRATRAHFGQIFMLYSDPSGEVEGLLARSSAPDLELRDEYGVTHQLWRISDPGLIEMLRGKMRDKKLIIADGHHRYETALAYRNERRAAATSAPGAPATSVPRERSAAATHAETTELAPYEMMMMTFINMDSAGLVVLPTHRVVHGLDSFSADAFAEGAREHFSVEQVDPAMSALRAEAILREEGKAGTALLAVAADRAFLLHTPKAIGSEVFSGLSLRQQSLDVVQLHKALLEGVLGLSPESIRDQQNLSYVRDTGEALTRVRTGAANVAFLMNPARMQQVRDIAFASEVLPQKSTDFYPKLLSGLTIYALE
jgi:uncharacterized protein (DUF1015 family)